MAVCDVGNTSKKYSKIVLFYFNFLENILVSLFGIVSLMLETIFLSYKENFKLPILSHLHPENKSY